MDQEYGAPPSGLPPLAWLSGLSFTNPELMSGVGDTSLGGSQRTKGFLPGMRGGLGLDQLTELLQQTQTGAEGIGQGNAGSLMAAIGGNLGSVGGFTNFSQPQYQTAGQTQAPQAPPSAYQTAGATNTTDPLALVQKLLGFVAKGVGSAGGTGGYSTAQTGEQASSEPGQQPLAPGGNATTPTDAALGELGINTDLASLLTQYGQIDPATGLPQPGTQSQPFTGPNGVPLSGFGETPPSLDPALLNALFGPNALPLGGPGSTPYPGVGGSPMFSEDQLRQIFGVGGTGDVTRANLTFTNAYQSPGQEGAFNPFSEFGLANLEPQGAEFLPRGYATGPTPQDAETFFAPGGSARNVLGGETATNWPGAASGGVGSLLGLLNLYQSAQKGNIPGAVGGGLGTVGGLAQLIASSPELMQALNLTPGALSGVGAGVGGLSALLGLGTGISQLAEGNALGAIPTVQGAFAGLAATPAIYSALSGVTPRAIAAGQSALGAAGPALQAAGAYAPAVLMAAQAIYDSISELEGTAKLRSGAFNNPIAGKLYSQATEGVANANDILQRINAAGGVSGLPTESLLSALAPMANSLLPYYQTGQGGVRAIRASEAAGSPGTQSKDEYTQNFTGAKTGLEEIVHELLGRGLTYEQIGATAGVNPAWSGLSLDAGGAPWEYYLRGAGQYAKTVPAWADLVKAPQIRSAPRGVWETSGEGGPQWLEVPEWGTDYFIAPPPAGETGQYTPWMYAGASNINGLGTPLNTGSFTPENAFIAALGAAGYDPNALTPQEFAKGKSGQPDVAAMQGVASMYGGPLWMALARMGSNDFAPLIQQNFDPWATWSKLTPEQKLTAMGPTVFGPTQMAAEASGLGSYGGRVENPRVADFFAGMNAAPVGQYVPRYEPGSRVPPQLPQLPPTPTTPELPAPIPQLPAPTSPNATGLMALMQSLTPAQQTAIAQQPRVLDDETIRNMFQQYGLA